MFHSTCGACKPSCSKLLASLLGWRLDILLWLVFVGASFHRKCPFRGLFEGLAAIAAGQVRLLTQFHIYFFTMDVESNNFGSPRTLVFV